jgi:hypothetical protein
MKVFSSTVLMAILFLFSGLVDAQDNKEKVVQITGVCLVSDSLFPAPYVSVFRTRDHRGTFTNRDGYFTLPALVGDTLQFICTGLEPSYFIVVETQDAQVRIVQLLNLAPFEMSPLYVLPYPAPHELRNKLAHLDLPGDGHLAFKRDDISLTQYDGMTDFSGAAYRQASKVLQDRYNGGFNSGGNLLSHDAWEKFMRSVRSGEN